MPCWTRFAKTNGRKKVLRTFSAAFAGPVLAHGVHPGTAETVVEVLAGIMP